MLCSQYRKFCWILLILADLGSLLVAGSFPEICTVDDLIKDIDELDASNATLARNQASYHSNCNSTCQVVNVNGILREKCSEDDGGFAVYRCPNNYSLYYIIDYTRCYLKYYTLCDESATYSDINLAHVITDLLCACDENIQYDLGNNSCSIKLDLKLYLYCRKARTNYPYIAVLEACTGYSLICLNNIDHDLDRFNCSGSGRYCVGPASGFVASRSICDGVDDKCDDKSDEHNCDTTTGVYCDAEVNNTINKQPEQYIKPLNVCDKEFDCEDNNADEEEARCEANYCTSIVNDSKTIFMSSDMMCNGSTECSGAEDENITTCHESSLALYMENGASCDNGTKWVRQKYLCTGRGFCDDGMDNDTDRWNCSTHEICPDPDNSDETVLCNSTLFCQDRDPGSFLATMAKLCNKCENGTSNAVSRCRDSENGIICNVTEIDGFTEVVLEKFIHKSQLCDGDVDCLDEKDEIGCENGYYCGNQFIPWERLCNGYTECTDGSDEQCDSTFFDKLIENDVSENKDKKSYLNLSLIMNTSTSYTDEYFEKIIKHRIFACQRHLYNMSDPETADVINNTMEEFCINSTKFECNRRYFTHFESSMTIMKEWLCDEYDDCAIESGNAYDEKGVNGVTKCRSGTSCYSDNMECDGIQDCDDKTDEIGCSDSGLRCNDTIIEDAYICDGFDDCLPYGEDEKICDNNINETDTCDDSDEQFTLYTNVSESGDSYTFSEAKFNIPANCQCENLRGGKYMAAVCSTVPDEPNQPCTDSDIFNNTLCYPVTNGSWFTDMYSELDESCKLMTNTLALKNETLEYTTFVQFYEGAFLDKSIYCKTNTTRRDNKCGIELENMCDLVNDCGDWSDESDEYCKNNFMCKTADGTTTRVIASSKKCDGTSDCENSLDECLSDCTEDFLTSTVNILGDGWELLTTVWIFGTVALIFNFYLIITMTKSAFNVLEKMPHRFIYRTLVTTIAVGDIMVSIYLVILASVDTFRSANYCTVKEQWLTGSTCILMGVISTFGNHLSLFAMVTLSFFRLKTVVHYLWPRTINKARAIRITLVLVFVMMACAAIIAVIPLTDSLKDYFVDRYYFPNRRNVFNDGSKESLYNTIRLYNDTMVKYNNPAFFDYADQIRNVTAKSSWEQLLNATESMFDNSSLTKDRKPYSFYSAYGVCLFNYLNSPENPSFAYVISIITMNLICFLAIIVCYMLIWKVGTTSKSTERQLQKKLSIAIALNILCRVPLFIICLVHSIEGPHVDGDACTGTCLYYRYMSVFVIPINSVINPFINSEVPLLELLGITSLFRKFKINSNTMETATNTLGITAGNATFNVSKIDVYNSPETPDVKTPDVKTPDVKTDQLTKL